MSSPFGADESFQMEAEGRLFATVTLSSAVKGFGGFSGKLVSNVFFCEVDAGGAEPGEGAKSAVSRLWSSAAWRRAQAAFAECPAALKAFGSGAISVMGCPTMLSAKVDPIRLSAAEKGSLPPPEALFETVSKIADAAFADLTAAAMSAPDFKGQKQGAVLAAEAERAWTQGLAAFAESRLIDAAAKTGVADGQRLGPRL